MMYVAGTKDKKWFLKINNQYNYTTYHSNVAGASMFVTPQDVERLLLHVKNYKSEILVDFESKKYTDALKTLYADWDIVDDMIVWEVEFTLNPVG
jgi:hypothetical protein